MFCSSYVMHKPRKTTETTEEQVAGGPGISSQQFSRHMWGILLCLVTFQRNALSPSFSRSRISTGGEDVRTPSSGDFLFSGDFHSKCWYSQLDDVCHPLAMLPTDNKPSSHDLLLVYLPVSLPSDLPHVMLLISLQDQSDKSDDWGREDIAQNA